MFNTVLGYRLLPQLAVLAVLFLVVGCVPIAWDREAYLHIGDITKPIGGGDYRISVSVIPLTRSSLSYSGPYRVVVHCDGYGKSYEHLLIKTIEVDFSSSKARESLLEEPIQIPFEQLWPDGRDNRYRIMWPEKVLMIEPDFQGQEKITITVEVAAIGENKTNATRVFEFEPKKSRGITWVPLITA